MKKEIPILFSTAMVQANLEGHKRKTRRIVKITEATADEEDWFSDPWPAVHTNEGKYPMRCPYGEVGDMLWVREMLEQHGELGLSYVADNEWISEEIIPESYGPYSGEYTFQKIPSIHMPKWAARIWLEVTGVRVERLQDISEEDCQAEGAERGIFRYGPGLKHCQLESNSTGFYFDGFKYLWNTINGFESWNSNPWVWVVDYEIISTTGKPTDL